MKRRLRLLLPLAAIFAATVTFAATSAGEETATLRFVEIPRSRIVVLTDMGNEADDSQTMVRLLVHANQFDVEGLIAVSSCHQYAGKNDSDLVRNDVQPTMITERIHAYGRVRDNLLLHADGWPTVEHLLSRTGSGPREYGMLGVGDGRSTDGSELIVRALTNGDPRPLYLCINAGANCLAQALWDLRARLNAAAFDAALAKLRIYDDAGQDDAGAWIARSFPHVRYLRSQLQVFNLMNNDGPVTWNPSAAYPGKGQHDWAREHVQTNHGPLGALYPRREKWQQPEIDHTLEGGGTSTWLGHANPGLYVPEEPTWGGWGGRFATQKRLNVRADQLKWADLVATEEKFMPFAMVPEAADCWTDPQTGIHYHGIGVPIFRWRRAYQNEFQARMDWCVQPYAQANHPPVAALNGDRSERIARVDALPGQTLRFDASASSDPDGDTLTFRWYFYPEAGTHLGPLPIIESNGPLARFTVTTPPHRGQLHLILEVQDKNSGVPLTAYRRVVIDCD
ncbi:DUF1593 domain-containing protein [Oleiharenicola lentus]|uniref:DUF1593 domain-containing protein n=1 Tax=Oleiharenicola lentus TaxID=2508720 RepID=A0A4Q1CBB5_9BACT|nr:nucleoside hydrolase-like domain-containing protein [Oleiharenicola lentus]RXK56393.1 DUF1593 domain-containing protein [Oleiharenicola lentus]